MVGFNKKSMEHRNYEIIKSTDQFHAKFLHKIVVIYEEKNDLKCLKTT